MNEIENALDVQVRETAWAADKCDKYDYMIAAFCGFAAGIIDSVLVKAPGVGALGQLTDKGADELVKSIANMLWKGDDRTTAAGKPHLAPDTLEKSISYLENAFPVNYDARYAADLAGAGGRLTSMSPMNHHLYSLAHSPDIIGLSFSILDQFTDAASFVDRGKVIRLYPVKDARAGKIVYMQGTNLLSRVFCGICNWMGHIISDLCGSSSTRRPGKTGRGAGVPMPFYSLFLTLDFGDFDGNTFAQLAVKIFEGGYDLRHFATMAIPVAIEEMAVRLIWALKKHFYAHYAWRDCIPSEKHADLRVMLIVANATLCVTDAGDAAIRSAFSGGNPMVFLLHLNLAAWMRLITLVFRELAIRYGSRIEQAFRTFLGQIGLNDRAVLKQYYENMKVLDQSLDQKLKSFVAKVEKEYAEFMRGVDESLNPANGTPEDRMRASIYFAESVGVPQNRIVYSVEEMRFWLEGGDGKG